MELLRIQSAVQLRRPSGLTQPRRQSITKRPKDLQQDLSVASRRIFHCRLDPSRPDWAALPCRMNGGLRRKPAVGREHTPLAPCATAVVLRSVDGPSGRTRAANTAPHRVVCAAGLWLRRGVRVGARALRAGGATPRRASAPGSLPDVAADWPARGIPKSGVPAAPRTPRLHRRRAAGRTPAGPLRSSLSAPRALSRTNPLPRGENGQRTTATASQQGNEPPPRTPATARPLRPQGPPQSETAPP